jgi:hypothetical protein
LKYLIIAVIAISFSSCSFFFGEEAGGRVPIAKVNNITLYEDEIKDIFFAVISADDSIALRQNYINNWIREQLIIDKALKNLSDVQKNKDKELKTYYNTLIRYAYEQELLGQRLDTVVHDKEIIQYYNQNKQNFELKRNIIQLRYIKLPKEAPSLENATRWYKSDSNSDLDSLQNYAVKFAVNYSLDDVSWFYFDDILKEIPIHTYDQEHFLKNNKFIQIDDESFIYLVNIKGFRIKDEVSPLNFERENIKRIILHQRKKEIIRAMEESIFKDGVEKNYFKIY